MHNNCEVCTRREKAEDVGQVVISSKSNTNLVNKLDVGLACHVRHSSTSTMHACGGLEYEMSGLGTFAFIIIIHSSMDDNHQNYHDHAKRRVQQKRWRDGCAITITLGLIVKLQ